MPTIKYRGPAESAEEMMESLRGAYVLAVDTETINIKDNTCIGIGIQWSDTEAAYFQVLPYTSNYLPEVMRILGDRERTKIYFNGMFDLRVLKELAFDEGYDQPDSTNIDDASIMAQIQGYPDHSLYTLTKQLLSYENPLSIKELLLAAGKKATMLDVPMEDVAEKCLNDVWSTWNLFYKLASGVPNMRNEDCYRVDIQCIPILFKMESKGLALREKVLEEHYVTLRRELLKAEQECDQWGFKPGSGQQVGYVLASKGHILPFTASKRQLRTDEEALENIDDPLVETILSWRHASKLLSTYVEPWMQTDRAYTHFRLDLSTGRLASFNRNFQNIPPDMRAVFAPDKRKFSWMDYSQIELRVLAHISKDDRMLQAYLTGDDLHQITASAAGATRSQGKTVNFAMVFGASDKVIARNAKVDIKRVAEIRRVWKDLYPGAAAYMARQQYTHGDYVESDFGRRMGLPVYNPEVNNNPRAFEAHVQKCAINWPIQSTAADIIKRAMITMEDADLRVQVHDELVVDGEYEFDKNLAHIHPELHTPYEVTVDYSWK